MWDLPFLSYLDFIDSSLLLLFFLIHTFSLDINTDQTAAHIKLKILQDVGLLSVICAITFI